MSFKKTLLVAALVVTGSVADGGRAATSPATATFQVLITIQKDCTVTAGASSNINFGQVDSATTNSTGSSNISVTCSKTTPYYIGLAPSTANGGDDNGDGNMASTTGSGNTDKVPYKLSSTAGPTGTPWGNTATQTTVGNGVAGTGTGAAQSIPVYATVPNADFTPDSYADTVTVNVNF